MRAALACVVACVTGFACETNNVPPPRTVDGVDDASSADVSQRIEGAADILRLADVRRIQGDLIVAMRGSDAIELPALERIDGALLIVGRAGKEVSGNVSLPELTHVGGDLQLAWTTDASRLELPKLASLGGHLSLMRGNWSIDLPALTTIAGDVRIADGYVTRLVMPELAEVRGSIALRRFDWRVSGGAAVWALPSLTSVALGVEIQDGAELTVDAPALVEIGADLEVSDMAILLRLPALARVGDDLRLSSLGLRALELGALALVGGDLVLERCDAEEEIALPALTTVAGALTVRSIDGLARLSLGALTDLGRAFEVSACPDLAALDVSALAVTTSDVVIGGNGALTPSAPRLTTIGGDLLLDDNARLDALFDALADVVGSIHVQGGTLVALALPELASIGRDLTLTGLVSEVDAFELPKLARLGGSLSLTGTTYLDRLSLPELPSIGSTDATVLLGDLRVQGNQHIAVLEVAKLSKVSRDIIVTGNPRLTEGKLSEALGAVTAGGFVIVCDNADPPVCE